MQNKIFRMVPLRSEEEIPEVGPQVEREAKGKLLEIYIGIARRQLVLVKRLVEEPEGFPIKDACNCFTCGIHIDTATGWYSRHGSTCFLCLKAFEKGILPMFISKNHDSFFNLRQLKEYYDFSKPDVMMLMKKGLLKGKSVLKENGKVHTYVFLKKENLGLVDRDSAHAKSIRRHNQKVINKF